MMFNKNISKMSWQLVAILLCALLLTTVQATSNTITSNDGAIKALLITEELSDIPQVIKSVVPTPNVDAKSWMLVDYESGWVVGSKNKDLRIEPASLTKLMTSFLVFESLKNGGINLNDQVYVSQKAWKTGGSRMFIQVDTQVDVESLLKGLIIQSGNDAAVALAEYLGGTEEGFAVQMNQKASELGMYNSHFTNASGLPDPDHYMTAEDIVILSRAIIRNFPDLFTLYSTKEYTYNEITQKNRNSLLWRDETVDGFKTGYTKAAGYCLVGTAKRDDMRFIAIVTGAESKKTRADAVQSLLQYGYAAYDSLTLFESGKQVTTLPLWMGTQEKASVGVDRNLGLIFPKGQKSKLTAALEIPESLEAPLKGGEKSGSIIVKYDGTLIHKQSLYVLKSYAEGSWWSQMMDSVKRLF